MSKTFDERLSTSYAAGFESLQQRFDGQILVNEAAVDEAHIDPAVFLASQDIDKAGFRDISAPAIQLKPLIGRVVLYLNRRAQTYQPAVITQAAELQMTILEQPYAPNIGMTNGMLFALGLKNDTQRQSFGAHTTAGGFEAGHFAPAMIGAVAADVRDDIVMRGDQATHATGTEVGGIPEKMIQQGLLGGIALKTVTLNLENPHPIPLAWHDSLERNEGLMLARYRRPTNAVKLMLGAASNQLGERAVDRIGTLTDAAMVGA